MKADMNSFDMTHEIEAQLVRLGYWEDMDERTILVNHYGADTYIIEGEYAVWTSGTKLLGSLIAMPDGASYEKVWDAVCSAII